MGVGFTTEDSNSHLQYRMSCSLQFVISRTYTMIHSSACILIEINFPNSTWNMCTIAALTGCGTMKVYKMLGVQSMEYLSLVGLIVVIFKITEGDVFVYVFHSPCLQENQNK